MNFATGGDEQALMNTRRAIALDTGSGAPALTPTEWAAGEANGWKIAASGRRVERLFGILKQL